MITSLLLAIVNFIVTVAVHVAEISAKVAAKAAEASAQAGKVVVEKGAQVGKVAVEKGVEVGKKVAEKGVEAGKAVAEKSAEATQELKEDVNAVKQLKKVEKESEEEEVKKRKLKKVTTKVFSLKMIQKSLHTVVVLLRASCICVIGYLFVLTTLVITGTLALASSAGYVALAYDKGAIGEGTDDSFDISKDHKKDDDSSNTTFIKGDTSTIEGKLETLAKWYIANIHTYGRIKDNTLKTVKANDLMDGLECRNDCTGFARAFVNYVSGNNNTSAGGSSGFVTAWNATSNGWTYYETKDLTSLDDLQLGDILVASPGNTSKGGTKSEGGYGHAEIYVDNKHSFGWGSVQKAYPKSNNWTFKQNSQGRNVVADGGHMYVCFYRYTGK